MTEKQIENQILHYLNYLPKCTAEKVNNIGVYDPKKQTYRTFKNKYCMRGVSDISGTFRGKSLRIEVKTPDEYKYIMKHYDELSSGIFTKNVKKKQHFNDQIRYLNRHSKAGAIAFFASSVDQVKEELAKWQKN